MALRRYGIILLLALVTWPAGAVRAQSNAAHEVVIGNEGGTHQILIHPAYLTVLHFPSGIMHVLVSDQKNFIVQLDGKQVILRPMNHAPPNAVANLHVLTADMKVIIFLRITSDVDQAVSQVIFRKPDPLPTGPSLRERLSFSIGGIFGRTTIEDTDPEDTREESMSSAPLVGVEARVSLAGSSHHNYEVAFALAQSDMRFTQVGDTRAFDVQAFSTALVFTRLQFGALFHFGERILPRFRLGGGLQSRTPIGQRMEFRDDDDIAVVEGGHEPWRYDVLMVGGTSIEMPIHGHWRAGVGVNAMRSVSVRGPTFVSIEGAAFMRWL